MIIYKDLNKLLSVKDVPDIKVITGVRRSGKSKLMDAFIDLISADDKAMRSWTTLIIPNSSVRCILEKRKRDSATSFLRRG
ncbi:hypothetical protein [Butyrivibrio sp. AE2032]|uniref:hypothetical protein n=1 Tax=Butyrivibrio sp. AE2032 TaxID=1458463 RepID=UPI0005577886|nr:hypothetical protein [Butyrivibrio sp. AE2032]